MGSRAEADLRAQQKASSFLRGARAGGSSDLPRPGRGRGGCGATPPRPSSRSRFIISRLRCAPSGCPPHPHPSPRVLDFSPTAAPRHQHRPPDTPPAAAPHPCLRPGSRARPPHPSVRASSSPPLPLPQVSYASSSSLAFLPSCAVWRFLLSVAGFGAGAWETHEGPWLSGWSRSGGSHRRPPAFLSSSCSR